MFSNELDELLVYVSKVKRTTRLSYHHLYPILLTETAFLPLTSNAAQRLWYLKNNTKTIPTCKVCEAPVKWGPEKNQYRVFCTLKCSNSYFRTREKIKQTNLDRYGVENPLQSKQIRQKRKQTMLKKYGTEYSQQNKHEQEKTKQTNLDTYGTEYPWQSIKVKEKIKQTNLDRYGVENPSQNNKIKEKKEQTNIEKYGVANPFQSDQIKEKIKQTNIEKYGVAYPTQAVNIRNKIKKTFIERYKGHPMNVHIINSINHLNNERWLEKQYLCQKKTMTQIAAELSISDVTVGNYLRKHKIETRIVNLSWSLKCALWLQVVMKKQDIFVQHEYKIPETKFRADGYCEETNTIYEFYGDLWHGNPEVYNSYNKCHPYDKNIQAGQLYQITMKREKVIRELGYNLVTIWESEWDKQTQNDKLAA